MFSGICSSPYNFARKTQRLLTELTRQEREVFYGFITTWLTTNQLIEALTTHVKLQEDHQKQSASHIVLYISMRHLRTPTLTLAHLTDSMFAK